MEAAERDGQAAALDVALTPLRTAQSMITAVVVTTRVLADWLEADGRAVRYPGGPGVLVRLGPAQWPGIDGPLRDHPEIAFAYATAFAACLRKQGYAVRVVRASHQHVMTAPAPYPSGVTSTATIALRTRTSAVSHRRSTEPNRAHTSSTLSGEGDRSRRRPYPARD